MGIFGYIFIPLALSVVCVIGWASGRRKRVAQRRNAIHEASHAVVALAVGLKVETVEVVPRNGSIGRMLLDKRQPFSYETDAVDQQHANDEDEADIVQTLSGPIGERRYAEPSESIERWSLVDAYISDLKLTSPFDGTAVYDTIPEKMDREFKEALPRVWTGEKDQSVDDFERDVRRLVNQANDLVDQHWEAILAAGSELLRRRTMSGEQLETALRSERERASRE